MASCKLMFQRPMSPQSQMIMSDLYPFSGRCILVMYDVNPHFSLRHDFTDINITSPCMWHVW